MLIPNWISLVLISVFLPVALGAGFGITEIGMHFGAGLVVITVAFALFARGVIGGGDAKLAAATAIWMGWSHTLDYLLVASVFGGALTLAVLATRRYPLPRPVANLPFAVHLHAPETGIPYGLALAAAGLVVLPETALWSRLILQG